ncbi:MAG: hypothetical protein M3Q45_02125, partial [Chloroflexota bacterium]|nr:hypothetical protein [Chloroflexota bacterium]
MTTKPCAATTKSGAPCKNKAQTDSNYCYTHRNQAVAATAPASSASAQFNRLIDELNSLAGELRTQLPDYTPPTFSAGALVSLLRENLHRFTPELQVDLARQLKANLEGTSPQDLVDPETWKGLWYVLNY